LCGAPTRGAFPTPALTGTSKMQKITTFEVLIDKGENDPVAYVEVPNEPGCFLPRVVGEVSADNPLHYTVDVGDRAVRLDAVDYEAWRAANCPGLLPLPEEEHAVDEARGANPIWVAAIEAERARLEERRAYDDDQANRRALRGPALERLAALLTEAIEAFGVADAYEAVVRTSETTPSGAVDLVLKRDRLTAPIADRPSVALRVDKADDRYKVAYLVDQREVPYQAAVEYFGRRLLMVA
jgi:hypothetical protein